MGATRRTVLFGFLVWLLTFVVAFLAFPFRESNRPLFESIMPVALAGIVTTLGLRLLGAASGATPREGLRVGLIWLLINIAIDVPLMLFGGPMQMTLAEYVADIGVTYLMIPVITTGIGAALARGRSI